MSTKTNFKRIALVAVAALGLGVLSSVPSQAAVVGLPTITATNGTATLLGSDSKTAATLAVKFNATAAADSLTISVTLGAKPSGAAGANDSVMTTVADTATSTGGVPYTGRLFTDTAVAWATQSTVPSHVNNRQQVLISSAAGVAAAKFRYQLDTALVKTAGTYTLDYVVKVYSAGAEVTTSAAFGQMLITVSDGSLAADGAVTAAGTSSAVLYQGATFADGNTLDSTSVSVVNTPDATVDAVIRITQKTAAGLPSRESITVTTNIGNLGQNGGGAAGKSLVLIGDTDGIDDIQIYGDGTAGTATITVKTTSVTFTSKTVVFYGTVVSTITGTALLTTIGSTSSNVILATPKDSSGNVVRSANSVYMYSSDVNIINTGTAPAGTSCGSYNSDYDGFLCQIGGTNNGTATITLRDAATTTASKVASTAISLTVNTAAAAKFTLAFDKASYAPGEKAYVIIKPLDVAGKAIGGGAQTNLFAAGGITSSMAFGNGSDTLTAASVTTAGTLASQGVASTEAVKLYTVYMPSTGGTVKITATGGSLLPLAGQVAVSASATVTDSGAAALAAVTALATTVASLKTLITTLTNLVLKIQKKVKA